MLSQRRKGHALRFTFSYQYQLLLKSIALLLLIYLGSFSVFAQNHTYQTNMITGDAPTINGIIDEAAWESVEWSGDFTQREPYENQPPSQQTSFKILYDNNNLG